jgi:TPP-dependent indolepyruvate ferredoxin oxidoreductase alpha subunit
VVGELPVVEALVDLGSRPANANGLWVDGELCHACRRCLARRACKVRAIVQLDLDEPPFIDAARCYGCRVCLSACPFDAIIVRHGLTQVSPTI